MILWFCELTSSQSDRQTVKQMDKHKAKNFKCSFFRRQTAFHLTNLPRNKVDLTKDVYLDIVSDKDSAQIEHLQHGGSVVVDDAVSLQDVLRPCDLPRQPAQVEGCITGQQVRQVPRLTTAAAFVVFISFCYSFHLSLLAVCPLAERKRECAASYWGRRKQRMSCKLTFKVCSKVVCTYKNLKERATATNSMK